MKNTATMSDSSSSSHAHTDGIRHKSRRQESSSRPEVPERFQDDPVVSWAGRILSDPRYDECDLKEHFQTLRNDYVALLRRLSKITRISDGYQRGLKETNEELTAIAWKDPLTGIANRRAMLQQLESEMSRVRRHKHSLGIISVDIDNFKEVNDSFGHEAGDTVLTAVAKGLAGHVRTEDGCARWGGEEFIIYVPHADRRRTGQVAEKLRSVIAELDIRYHDKAIPVTISLGVSTFNESHSLDDLIREADRALMRAKELGKNRVEITGDTP